MAKASKASAGGKVAPATRYKRTRANDICAQLAEGKPWVEICEGEGMPTVTTAHLWLRRHADFAEDVAAARAVAAERWADEALKTALNTTAATASADRLRVATLLGRAAIDSPQRWGGKTPPLEREDGGELTFRFRRFEKVVGPDGRTVLREVFPENDA